MLSKKCQKYMTRYEERNYATKERKVEKSDLREYCDRSKFGKVKEEKITEVHDEENRKKELSETHEQGRQGFSWADQRDQGSDQRRRETEETDTKISEEKIKKISKEGKKELKRIHKDENKELSKIKKK